MSDTSSSSSSASQQAAPIRRCRKTSSRSSKDNRKKWQAKRNSSCGAVEAQPTVNCGFSIRKTPHSSPEDVEVDSILQSSSTDDDRDVSSSISSDNDEEDDEEEDNRASNSGIFNITCDITKCNEIEDEGHANDPNARKYDIRQNVEERKRISTASTVSTSPATKISNLERLIRTHPVWFQPDLNRDDTTLLLQGKEDGTFIVRKSSQSNTMAISVRLPDNLNDDNNSLTQQRDFVQHYLIEQHHTDVSQEVTHNTSDEAARIEPKSKTKMKLESSNNSFDNILSLVYHYLTVREELPVLLTLPRILKDTESRQTLSSLALLGKDFWRYPMSFLQPPIPNEITEATVSSQLQDTAFPKQQHSSNSVKEITSHGKQISNSSGSFASMHIKKQSHSVSQTAKEEIEAPLNDTLLGLQEVGDLLQASLKEIEYERVIANDSNESVTSFTSNANRENSIPIALSDRNKNQNRGTKMDIFDDNNYKNDSSYRNQPISSPLPKQHLPNYVQQHSFPPISKVAYQKANNMQSLDFPKPIAQKATESPLVVPPTPPIRTTSSRHSSPALSPGRDRRHILTNDSGLPPPPTAAAALLQEIRNSVSSPTPFVIPLATQNLPDTEKPLLSKSCQRDSSPQLVNISSNVGRKLSARQSFSNTSLKIVQDCKHPNSNTTTPTGSPPLQVSPQPQSGMSPFLSCHGTASPYELSGKRIVGVRKISSPATFFASQPTAVSSNGNYSNGLEEYYCRSSITDKMSDYEDIWNDTLPTSKHSMPRPERSITPAESEQNFKAYLASKLLSSSSGTPSMNNFSNASSDAIKSLSISSSDSSTNTNKSKSSIILVSSSSSCTAISNSSPVSSLRASSPYSASKKASFVQPSHGSSNKPPPLAKRSISVSSEMPPNLQNTPANFIQSNNDQRYRRFSASRADSKLPYNNPPLILNPQSETLAQSYNINRHETFTTLSSSSSGSATSAIANFNTKGSHDTNIKQTEDPVYSYPLDALENATDTRIYNCPEFKENTFTSPAENIYEETTHMGKSQNAKKLLPLIESDHESSDCSSISSFTSSSSYSNMNQGSSSSASKKVRRQRRRRSENSLTNLSEFEKLFSNNQGDSTVLMHSKEDDTIITTTFGSLKDEVGLTKQSLSMEDLNKECKLNAAGYPLNQVRKTSISSSQEKQTKRNRKPSSSSVPIKRREKPASNGNKSINRLSAVIGKYIRPTSGVNHLELPKSTSWQLDSSSWEFLGEQEESKTIGANAANSNLSTHVSNQTENKIIKTSNVNTVAQTGKNSQSNTHINEEIPSKDELLKVEHRKLTELCHPELPISISNDQVPQTEVFSKINNNTETQPRHEDATKTEKVTDTKRLNSASPYDNLFLNSKNDSEQRLLNGNYTKDQKSMDNSPDSRDIYTSDDSVYQSDEDQSNRSDGSTCNASPTNIVRHEMPRVKGRKQIKQRPNHKMEKSDGNVKPRVGIAVRKSTASVVQSHASPPTPSPPSCNNSCRIHGENDFIDYPKSNFGSVPSTPSSTLSSKHLYLSKNRIQDYIRQLNKSFFEHQNDSGISAGENQVDISKNLQNGVDAKKPGLLLQVIDNFVSCTIDGIGRRIKQLQISNDRGNGNEGCDGNANKNNLIKDNDDINGLVEVMKNVRQFISGVKNYLIKTGEGDLHTIMQEERSKLQWDECLNLDAILEEVLQQLIIPSLRPSMVELRNTEMMSSSESRFKQPNILKEATSVKYSKQIEEILISRLPTRIQEAFNSSYTGTNKGVFNSTMAELNGFGNIDTTINELETAGKRIGISPLEQLNRLPNIVKTIIDESKACMTSVHTSSKPYNRWLNRKNDVAKGSEVENQPAENNFRYQDSTPMKDVAGNCECSCPNDRVTLGNFCVLLALAITQFQAKKDDSENGNDQTNNIVRYLEVEAEMMWNIIPQNMLSGEPAFFLTLFSTSCNLVQTITESLDALQNLSNSQLTVAESTTENENIQLTSAVDISIEKPKECLPILSDSDTTCSSEEAKTNNLLISCVGRRKRRKKKKMSNRRENQKMNNQVISTSDKINVTLAIGPETTAAEDNIMEKENQAEESNNAGTSPLENLEHAIDTQSKDETTDHTYSIKKQPGLAPESARIVGLTFVKVLIPNEQNGTISATSIPVIKKYDPCGTSSNKGTVGTRVRDAMAIIAYNQKVVNPHEFALYLLNFESKTLNKQNDNSAVSGVANQLLMDINSQDTFFERRLYDADVLENILWTTKSTERGLATVIAPYCLDLPQNKDERSSYLTQNGISNSPSNFLVYKRKDAKIAWPSAVSLLHKKQEGQNVVSTRDLTTK